MIEINQQENKTFIKAVTKILDEVNMALFYKATFEGLHLEDVIECVERYLSKNSSLLQTESGLKWN
ncbi:hypothetical protein V1477_001457 [Vespula maculifrons]|uniref:Uncharacterized protein n=1 Tax=Vespula maculifrons TaxID=7453 RepID=A0ABD2CYV8_VESMC